MSTAAPPFVVDASVGIKLVIPEDHSDRAAALFELLAQSPPIELHVPDLFYIECTNVLWKLVRRDLLTAKTARSAIEILGGLDLVITPTGELMEDALTLGLRHDISAYDAAYVALSDRLAAPLITADQVLVRKLDGAGHQVHWLGTLEIKPGEQAEDG